jgi:hypothetical protein
LRPMRQTPRCSTSVFPTSLWPSRFGATRQRCLRRDTLSLRAHQK